METTINLKCTLTEVESLCNKGINDYADLRYYKHNGDNKATIIVRHNDQIELTENATYSIKGLIDRCTPHKTRGSYHLITFSPDSGEDDGSDCHTLKKAIEQAKEYLQDDYYEWVKILHNHKEIKHFQRFGEQVLEK